jgi:predicted DCC family thiol-disulfide oxidoreductase YuxK
MPGDQPPLILFDGVCHLCNAAIAWIVERDRRGLFRFGSLQSAAGHAVLKAANAPQNLPDSMILIDDKGLHTRSDAAIGIASRLGLPWRLAWFGRWVPRLIRDRAYDVIARNRYQWFGRRETCPVPTPELRARFLDADEPRTQIPESPTPIVPETSERMSLIPSIALRWLMAGLFLHIFPWPIGTIPFTGQLAELYEKQMLKFVAWAGKLVFGLNITIFPGGSGDTTWNYVEVFLYAVVALVLAIGWTWLRRGRPFTRRMFDAMQVLVRYYLGMVMLSYGWNKIIPLQFPAPGPDRLLMSYGDSSPMGLLWTFMGASKAYETFSGLIEAAGGLLLLFRRTTLLGCLVSTVVLTNIVLMNFCYDVPVKLYSSLLLLMALFVVGPHAVRLFNLFFLNLPMPAVPRQSSPIRPKWLERTAWVARFALIACISLLPGWSSYQMFRNQQSFATKAPWAGYYRVESFTRDEISDRALPDSQRWVRVGIGSTGLGVVVVADGSSRRQRMQFDEAKSTVTITRRGETNSITLKFKQPEGGSLILEGPYDGANVSARLRRSDDAPPLLISRGFHWINEYPFNR